ncbi:MAG: cbb3-type cytochrome c oxidase N-terminal domain-containing protein [Phycisphaerales bacterium JB052]
MSEYSKNDQNQQDELLDHNYDGIQEYDNPIPGWWHLIFLGSMIFSVCYVVVFHMTPIVPSRDARWASALAAAEEAQFGPLKGMPLGQDKILAVMGNEKWKSAGASIFKGTCAVCHGDQGQGIEGLGLNLTDDKYVNIDSLMDIYNIVKNGSPNKKMPPQAQFGENEIAMVAGYVASLRGENVPGPESQMIGEVIPPFPQPEVSSENDG